MFHQDKFEWDIRHSFWSMIFNLKKTLVSIHFWACFSLVFAFNTKIRIIRHSVLISCRMARIVIRHSSAVKLQNWAQLSMTSGPVVAAHSYIFGCRISRCLLCVRLGEFSFEVSVEICRLITHGKGSSTWSIFVSKQNQNTHILISIIIYQEDISKLSLAQVIFLYSVNPMIGYNFL